MHLFIIISFGSDEKMGLFYLLNIEKNYVWLKPLFYFKLLHYSIRLWAAANFNRNFTAWKATEYLIQWYTYEKM